jgi:hypothetical protein
MDFGKVNVMTGLHPLAELNTKLLAKALTILKAFKDQLTLAHSTNSPILILAATVSKFSNRSQSTNSNVGTLAQFLFLHPPFQRTPRISAAMQSAIRLPLTRA